MKTEYEKNIYRDEHSKKTDKELGMYLNLTKVSELTSRVIGGD